MKRLAAGLFVLSIVLILPSSAMAERGPMTLKQVMGFIHGGTIVIPPEWDGVWDYSDSTYDCTGSLQGTDSGTDTLCAGAEAYDAGPNFSCTGSADATTISIKCSGTEQFMPDCVAVYHYDIDGTRVGNTAFLVSTVTVTYEGTAIGCDLNPASCTQFNSHTTRTGPAPADYCATPVRPSTWGELKIRYR